MQTFLPYKSYRKSASVLDRQRLGKQRVEGLQILHCLLGIGSQRWRHHPAVKMWRGAELSLAHYVLEVCHEWTRRGYKDTVAGKVVACLSRCGYAQIGYVKPQWLGNYRLHRSHQSNLIRKSPAQYRALFPRVPSTLPYMWPTQRKTRNGKSSTKSR